MPKIAEIDVYFIRLPFVGDDYVKNGLKSIVDGALQVAEWSSWTGGKRLWSDNPRLKEVAWGCWCCTLDVFSEGTPIPWHLIVGIIIGAVLAGVIIYYVQIRPLQEALVETAKTISEVQQELTQAHEEGEIPTETYTKITRQLEEAQKKAIEVGAPNPSIDWAKYLGKALEYAPFILGVIVFITILDMLRRR
ncbi:MAG: hypothetical protein QXO15_05265 [Nitrososphaerota archaeon]